MRRRRLRICERLRFRFSTRRDQTLKLTSFLLLGLSFISLSLHQSSQQFALASSQAGSVPPSSQRASSSFVRESSMAAAPTPSSSSRTRVSNINILEIPPPPPSSSSSSTNNANAQSSSTAHSIFSREDTEDIPSIASLTSSFPNTNTSTRETSSAAPQTLLRPSAQDSVTHYFNPLDFDDNFGVLSPEQLVVIRPYKGDDDDQVLEELRPKYIVMYDADPGFIRRVEVSLLSISIWKNGEGKGGRNERRADFRRVFVRFISTRSTEVRIQGWESEFTS